MRTADDRRFAPSIAAAEGWLRTTEAKSVLNAAAVLLGLGTAGDAAAARQRDACLALLQRGEAPDGGWGPYIQSPPESFDTALVLCALTECRPQGWNERLRRGRQFLCAEQRPDGSWPETTRPAGLDSYAQRLSTTGWATIALVTTKLLTLKE
jgi:hypothetical protein